MHGKVQISDDCKAEYAVEVQKTNEVQRDHYGNTVPQLFNVMYSSEFIAVPVSNYLDVLKCA